MEKDPSFVKGHRPGKNREKQESPKDSLPQPIGLYICRDKRIPQAKNHSSMVMPKEAKSQGAVNETFFESNVLIFLRQS